MKHVQNQILKYKISTTNMLQNLNSGCRSVRCFFSRGLLINSKLNELQCKNNKVLKTFCCSSNRRENAIIKENLLANIYLNLNYNEMLYLRIYKQFFLMCHHTKQIIFNNHYAFPQIIATNFLFCRRFCIEAFSYLFLREDKRRYAYVLT